MTETEHAPIDPRRTAVIVQGMQNDSQDPNGILYNPKMAAFMAAQNTLANIARITEVVRAGGGIVLYLSYIIEADGAGQPTTAPVFRRFVASGGMRRGTWGAEPYHLLPPQDGDLVLEKARVNPFYGSMLAPMLEGRSITTVIPVGTQTNMGIVSASRYAADAGYRVVIASDAAATDDSARHRATLDYALANVAEIHTTVGVVSLFDSAL